MEEVADIKRKYAKSTDGTRICYEYMQGKTKNPPLIFLHGLGGNLTAWKPIRVALRELGYGSIAIDMRGHGLSDHPQKQESYSLENFLQDVLAVIRQEHLKQPIIVGHCFGGMVALTLQGTHPNTARALVLIGTNYRGPTLTKFLLKHATLSQVFLLMARHAPLARRMKHADYSNFLGTGDYSLRRILFDIWHTSLRSYLYSLYTMAHCNIRHILKNITTPTLILSGTDDKIFSSKFASELADVMQYARVEFLQRENHIVVLNNPAILTKSITEFLRKQADAQAS